MVNWVHDHGANVGFPAKPTGFTGLTYAGVFMLRIADLSHCSHTLQQHETKLSAGHTDEGVFAFLCHQLSGGSGGTDHYSASTGLQLDVVDHGTYRDVGQLKSVAWSYVRLGPCHDGHPNLKSYRAKDVTFLSVGIVDQSDPSRTVGVIFHGGNLAGNPDLVSLKIYDTVPFGVSAPTMAHRDPTVVISTAFFSDRGQKRTLRLALGNLFVGLDAHETPTRRRGIIFLDSHCSVLPSELNAGAFEELYAFPFSQSNDGLFPGPALPQEHSHPLGLGTDLQGMDLLDLDLENRLNGLTDLGLVCLGMNLEGVLVILHHTAAFLGDDRPNDDIVSHKFH
jgi:hypothetical protein